VDLVFTRTGLLDEDLEPEILGPVTERLWQEKLREPAKLSLERLGITDRDSFILDAAGNYDERLSSALLMLGSIVPGRTTMEGYARAAARFLVWLRDVGVDLDGLDLKTLATYHRYRRRRLRVSPRSWNAEAAAIKTFLKAAVMAGAIRSNPLAQDATGWFEKAGTAGEEPKFLTMRQFLRFRDRGLAVGRYALRNVGFSNMMLSSGMRLDEGNDYQKEWLPSRAELGKATTNTLRHRVRASSAKGGKSRFVRVSTKAFETMGQYDRLLRSDIVARAIERGRISADPPQFWLNQNGTTMEENGWEFVFRVASERSGIKATPKTLRHTFAVHVLGRMIGIAIGSLTRVQKEALKTQQQVKASGSAAVYDSFFGDPLRRLQKLMGHAQYTSTFVYIDLLASIDGFEDESLAVFERFIDAEETYNWAEVNDD